MEVISSTEFGGERPLFESHNLRLENVVIRAGESAIKVDKGNRSCQSGFRFVRFSEVFL